MFLWIGLGASQDFIQQVFGVPSAIQIDIDKVYIPELNNPLSIAVRSIIDEIRLEKHRCMRVSCLYAKLSICHFNNSCLFLFFLI